MALILNGTSGLSDVDGSASTPAVRGTDTNTGIFFPAADTIAFAEGGAEVARFDSSGNLGVGIASPTNRLQVRGGNGNQALFDNAGERFTQLTLANNGTTKANFNFDNTNNVVEVYGASGSSMVFSPNATERMRIDSSGNLLVGKTSSGLATGVQLETNGGSSFIRSSSTNSDLNLYVYSTGAGAARFYVGMGGTVFATSTSISAISDQSLKENVVDIEPSLTKVMALRPVRFDWKEQMQIEQKQIQGFVAQEVEQILPDLVYDYQYNEGEIKKSIKMGDMIPTLVKAIQEQQAIITDLKSRIETLENK